MIPSDSAPRGQDGESPPFERGRGLLALTGGWDSAITMAERLPARKGERKTPPRRKPRRDQSGYFS